MTTEELTKIAQEYALNSLPNDETDDYWDSKQKVKDRLSIEEHFEKGYNSRNEEVVEWEDKFKEMQEYAMEKRQLLLSSVELNAKLNVENVILRNALEKIRADIKKYDLDEQFGLEENDYIDNTLKK